VEGDPAGPIILLDDYISWWSYHPKSANSIT